MRTVSERLLYGSLLGLLLLLTLATGACHLFYNLYPRPIREAIASITPPSGYYDRPLVSGALDCAQRGDRHEWTLTHPYKARHSASLTWRSAEDAPETSATLPTNTPLVVQVDFYLGDRLLRSRTLSSLDFVFYQKTDSAGCHLFDYEVPDEVPAGQAVRCVVTVLQPDPAWQQSTGEIDFTIERAQRG